MRSVQFRYFAHSFFKGLIELIHSETEAKNDTHSDDEEDYQSDTKVVHHGEKMPPSFISFCDESNNRCSEQVSVKIGDKITISEVDGKLIKTTENGLKIE